MTTAHPARPAPGVPVCRNSDWWPLPVSPPGCGAICVLMLALLVGCLPAAAPAPPGLSERLPVISPDYRDTVIPPNIAPLNFHVQEPGRRYRVRLHGPVGSPVVIDSRRPLIDIPPRPWRELLRANRGEPLHIDISVQTADRLWQNFTTITNRVAREEIDSYLVYRLLNWQFSMYAPGTMGIYQRDLESFSETTLLRAVDKLRQDVACMNCHTFVGNRPEAMALHIRSQQRGRPMLLAHGDQLITVDRAAGLLAWHPSGEVMIMGVNRFSMLFHGVGRNRDVFDAAGDLKLYHLMENRVESPPPITTPDYWETWPAWSPDGRTLFYCRTPASDPDNYQEVKYDLMRISYDLGSNTWGEPEIILAVKETGRSIAQPRVSPDGRWLMFCMMPYSSFPGTQPGSDLYVLDLQTGAHHNLHDVNSDRSESWHSWSTNSRWFVFSSKRRDGLLTRPYISYFDEQGRAHKPLLLPQRDPAHYDSFLKMYNLPELLTGPVAISARDLYEAVYRPKLLTKPAEATEPAAPAAGHADYSLPPDPQGRRHTLPHPAQSLH
jgi:hypothetical protein